MTRINSVSAITYPSNPTSATSAVRTEPDENQKMGITIEITPDEKNVDSGDRSQNTMIVSVTTPKNEFQAEVTREQVFNAVDQRNNKKLADQALGSDNNNRSLLKAAARQNAEQTAPYKIQQAAYLKVKQDQIDTYKTATANSVYKDDSSSSSSSQGSGDLSGVQVYNEAKNAYMKQEFIFSTLDRLDISKIV